MLTVLISFTGYPDPAAKGVEFRAGDTISASEFPKDFIDMIVAKGLAAKKAAEKAK
jgi:hypothetical protein